MVQTSSRALIIYIYLLHCKKLKLFINGLIIITKPSFCNTKLAQIVEDAIHVCEIANSSPCKQASTSKKITKLKHRLHRTLSCSGDATNQIIPTQRYPREVLFAIGGWHEGAPTNHMEVYGMRLKFVDWG